VGVVAGVAPALDPDAQVAGRVHEGQSVDVTPDVTDLDRGVEQRGARRDKSVQEIGVQAADPESSDRSAPASPRLVIRKLRTGPPLRQCGNGGCNAREQLRGGTRERLHLVAVDGDDQSARVGKWRYIGFWLKFREAG